MLKNNDMKALNTHILKTLETTIAAYLKNEVIIKVQAGEITLDTINAIQKVQSLTLRINLHVEPRTSASAISEIALLDDEQNNADKP